MPSSIFPIENKAASDQLSAPAKRDARPGTISRVVAAAAKGHIRRRLHGEFTDGAPDEYRTGYAQPQRRRRVGQSALV